MIIILHTRSLWSLETQRTQRTFLFLVSGERPETKNPKLPKDNLGVTLISCKSHFNTAIKLNFLQSDGI
jgi:hypothetical protein